MKDCLDISVIVSIPRDKLINPDNKSDGELAIDLVEDLRDIFAEFVPEVPEILINLLDVTDGIIV